MYVRFTSYKKRTEVTTMKNQSVSQSQIKTAAVVTFALALLL